MENIMKQQDNNAGDSKAVRKQWGPRVCGFSDYNQTHCKGLNLIELLNFEP